MLPRNTDWTKITIRGIVIVVGLVVLDGLHDIWKESGAADTVRGAGRSAGSSAGAVFENVMAYAIIAVIAGIGIWILVKIMRLFGGGKRGNARGGNSALRNAQREEYQSITAARSEAQQQVAQARNDATRRRDQAVRAAQAQVNSEQDRWV